MTAAPATPARHPAHEPSRVAIDRLGFEVRVGQRLASEVGIAMVTAVTPSHVVFEILPDRSERRLSLQALASPECGWRVLDREPIAASPGPSPPQAPDDPADLRRAIDLLGPTLCLAPQEIGGRRLPGEVSARRVLAIWLLVRRGAGQAARYTTLQIAAAVGLSRVTVSQAARLVDSIDQDMLDLLTHHWHLTLMTGIAEPIDVHEWGRRLLVTAEGHD